LAAGDHVWHIGCTSLRDGEVVYEGDAYAQLRQATRNVEWALGPALTLAYWPGVGSP
jgi:hypothetical protein